MKLKISESNKAAIESALESVNDRSYQHTYTTIGELLSVAARAEKRLDDLGLTKASRSGALYTSTSGASVPNSYYGTRNGTRVTIVRGSSDWFITDIQRATLSNGPGKSQLTLTVDQDGEIVRKVRASYRVAKDQQS